MILSTKCHTAPTFACTSSLTFEKGYAKHDCKCSHIHHSIPIFLSPPLALTSCIGHLSHFTMRSIESQSRRNGRKSRRYSKSSRRTFEKTPRVFRKSPSFFLIPHISSSAPSEIANNLMPKIRIELREEARRERRKSLSLQL